MRCQSRGGGGLGRDRLGERCEPPSPLRDGARRRGAVSQLLLDGGACIGIEHPEHVLGVAQIASVLVERRIHVSRQVRNCRRALRIQLFIVASGTSHRIANSLYVAPLKKASRTERLYFESSWPRQRSSRR